MRSSRPYTAAMDSIKTIITNRVVKRIGAVVPAKTVSFSSRPVVASCTSLGQPFTCWLGDCDRCDCIFTIAPKCREVEIRSRFSAGSTGHDKGEFRLKVTPNEDDDKNGRSVLTKTKAFHKPVRGFSERFCRTSGLGVRELPAFALLRMSLEWRKAGLN